MKDTVINHLRHLEKKHGFLSPDIVVDDALMTDSPLHGEFTWDKDDAARKFWLSQARMLIRSVKIIVTTETKTVSAVAYVRDPTKNKEQGYLSVENIRSDEDLAREVLVDEFKRAGAALKRAQRLAIAFSLENEIDAMVIRINTIRQDVEEYQLNA